MLNAIVDLCIGPYHNTSRVGYTAGLLSSRPLFFDEFFLVVPIKGRTFWELLLTPFIPFHWKAWIAIFIVTTTSIFVLNIIQTGDILNKQGGYFLGRLFQIMYQSVIACAQGGANVSEKPKMPEKIVAASFTLFALVTITAYTANSTAVLVAGVPPIFESLGDIEKERTNTLCVDHKVSDILIRNHPSTEGIVSSVVMTTAEIIENVGIQDSMPCDAAVVTKDAFNVATYGDNSGICENIVLLTGEVIMTVPNVIYFSSLYGQISIDFIKNVNMMIDVGEYRKINNELRKEFDEELGGSERCAKADKDDGEDANLDWGHFLSPLLLAGIGTTIAFFLYFLCRTSAIHMTKRAFTISSEDEDTDTLLLKRVEKMTAAEILSEIRELGVSQELISLAVNELPNKKQLISLLFREKCSHYSSQSNFVAEMLSFFELYTLSVYCAKNKVFDGKLDMILEHKSPKTKLVRVLLRNVRSSELVVSAAETKRDNIENFNIEEYLTQEIVIDEYLPASLDFHWLKWSATAFSLKS